ncbi:MAG: hypothetical protein LBL30_00010 [Holosporales bacterium]|nr:hypothetical protein [Holosporales bacterium]
MKIYIRAIADQYASLQRGVLKKINSLVNDSYSYRAPSDGVCNDDVYCLSYAVK